MEPARINIFSIIFSLIQLLGAKQIPGSVCNAKVADIVFLLDASFSLMPEDFQQQLKFVESLVQKFDTVDDKIRVGALTFSHKLTISFHLNHYDTKDQLIEAIRKIPYLNDNAGTDTAQAIRYARENMFKPENGGRDFADKLVVVITDGRSLQPEVTASEAYLAKEAGIKVFAIGVGYNFEKDELKAIASKPEEEFVFNVTSYKALDTLRESIVARACADKDVQKDDSSIKQEKERIQAKLECGGKPADIYFVLDASNSVWPPDFRKQLEFVNNIVRIFDIAKDRTRVGVVLFSDDVYPRIPLDNKLTKDELRKQVLAIAQAYGGTNTARAIKYIRETGFSQRIVRKNVAHVVIIVTDGKSMEPRKTLIEAEAAKKQGIEVFSVGIGRSADVQELRSISSNPETNYFKVGDFNGLQVIKNTLAIKACGVSEKPDKSISDQAVKTTEKSCQFLKSLDLMFIFDAVTIGLHKSKIIRKTIAEIVKDMDISLTDTRVGTLSHYTPPNTDLSFDQFQNEKQFISDLRKKPSDGIKNLLKILKQQSYLARNGGRKDAEDVGVIFLDKEVHDPNKVLLEIRRTVYQQTLYVVAIGNHMTDYTPEVLCNKNENGCLLHVPNYNLLTQYVQIILNMICKS